jgi:RNA polymerase sigma-70 factor (ECF subfamily)
MRRILVDHARARSTDKRGGELARVDIEDASDVPAADRVDLVDLDDALQRLAAIDARKSEMIEMRYFGGLTQNELAEVLGVSVATVGRDLAWATEWLSVELST